MDGPPIAGKGERKKMDFNEAIEVILAFWPLLVLQIGLVIWALADVLRRKTVKSLSKGLWIVIILFVSLFGPILYFIIGRGEE